MQFWFYFIAAFTVVIALLMIGVAVQEYWTWKKDGK